MFPGYVKLIWSRNGLSFSALGAFLSFCIAFPSICLILSLVRLKYFPTSSRVLA
ncbi:MAG TPA: hypothetical protein PLL89_01415 [bacterium]|nr:hypothetical protein [bacterium]